MAKKIKKWYMQKEDYDSVIVSSRVRLARNLSEFDFSEKITDEEAQKLIEKVRLLTDELSENIGTDFYSCNVSKLTDAERSTLAKEASINPPSEDDGHPTGLIVSADEGLSIMINEEDHIRIQAVVSGNNMKKAFAMANRIDDFVDSRLHYAYSDRYGYLTGCVTNVGTGLRASYILFLPGLTMAEKIAPLKEEVAKFGISLRNLYFEDKKNVGFLYLISNQKTLGCTEQDIFDNLDQITGQIVSLEKSKREYFTDKVGAELEDKIYRSYGVLKYARKLTLQDAIMLLAQVKLGVDWGILPIDGTGAELQKLMQEIQPAALAGTKKKALKKESVDSVRAAYLNKHIPNLKNDNEDKPVT